MLRLTQIELFCCVTMLVGAEQTAFAEVKPDQHAEAGLSALDEGDFDRAQLEFETGLALARKQSARKWEGRLLFYKGLGFQEQAIQAEAQAARSILERARLSYEEAIRVLPQSGPARNNLAQVHVALDNRNEARRRFQEAIELKDRHQAQYALNFADFFHRIELDFQATQLYRASLEIDPTNEQAYRGLIRCTIESQPQSLPVLLNALFAQGEIVRVQDTALRFLKEGAPEGVQPANLLAIVVRCLAAQSYSIASFPKSPVGKRLQMLIEVQDLREPVGQILLLHEPSMLKQMRRNPKKLAWWATKTRPPNRMNAPQPAVGWPQEAFTELIRSCGAWYDRRGNVRTAEDYYRLAFDLSPNHQDPKALIALVDLWLRHGEKARLEGFLEEQERPIFRGKGESIREGLHGRTFEYHKALGIIYAHLDRWGKPDRAPATTAFFQLEHALDAARRYNQKVQDPDRLIADPRLVQLLAKGYENKGAADRAFELRVAQTSYFQELDLPVAASEVFRTISEKVTLASVPDQIKQTFRKLKNDAVTGFRLKPSPFGRAGARKWLPLQPRGPGGVRAGRQAQIGFAMPDGADPKEISVERLQALASNLHKIIESSSSKPRELQFLDPETDDGILGAEFDGRTGQARLRGNDQPIEVRFWMEGSKWKGKLGTARYVRP